MKCTLVWLIKEKHVAISMEMSLKWLPPFAVPEHPNYKILLLAERGPDVTQTTV